MAAAKFLCGRVASSFSFCRVIRVNSCLNIKPLSASNVMIKYITTNCKNISLERRFPLVSDVYRPGLIIANRNLSSDSTLSKADIKKQIDDISEKFSEALELLNDARGSVGTVYYSDDMKEAEEMVVEVLHSYKALLQRLNTDQKLDVQRTIGLKMEELQAQLTLLKSTPAE